MPKNKGRILKGESSTLHPALNFFCKNHKFPWSGNDLRKIPVKTGRRLAFFAAIAVISLNCVRIQFLLSFKRLHLWRTKYEMIRKNEIRKHTKRGFLALVIIVLLASCSGSSKVNSGHFIQKRKYTKGFCSLKSTAAPLVLKVNGPPLPATLPDSLKLIALHTVVGDTIDEAENKHYAVFSSLNFSPAQFRKAWFNQRADSIKVLTIELKQGRKITYNCDEATYTKFVLQIERKVKAESRLQITGDSAAAEKKVAPHQREAMEQALKKNAKWDRMALFTTICLAVCIFSIFLLYVGLISTFDFLISIFVFPFGISTLLGLLAALTTKRDHKADGNWYKGRGAVRTMIVLGLLALFPALVLLVYFS